MTPEIKRVRKGEDMRVEAAPCQWVKRPAPEDGIVVGDHFVSDLEIERLQAGDVAILEDKPHRDPGVARPARTAKRRANR